MNSNTTSYQQFMQLAFVQAQLAAECGEVPIGAVIIKNNEILSSAFNQIESLKTACAHAEILAIQKASEKLGSWRLEDCELYVTLEPCPMCMGAIRLARISRLIISAADSRMGCLTKFHQLCTDKELGPVPEIISGILKEQSEDMLRDFFRQMRSDKNSIRDKK